MKKLLKKVMMCATMMAALVGFSSCEDDLDIQTNYPFEVEVMPVPTKVLRGQTVEIRCHLNKEGDYAHTLYTIRWFLYDGTGSLRMENGTVLQPNDRYLLENETFRLYYISASKDAHKFIVVIEDSNGNSQTLTFNSTTRIRKMRMRIRLLSLLCLCTVGMARATPSSGKLPYTERQFEMAVACIKHFEGWHTTKNYPYVGYGHQLQRGERYSARTLTKKQGDLLLRLDLMRNLYLFRGYGKDALLLSVLAYNVGPYAILGTSKRPKSRLLRKIERGDRNIYNDYIAFCRWHGKQIPSIKFRRQVEYDLFFVR